MNTELKQRVSIVCVTYRGAGRLAPLLDSIAAEVAGDDAVDLLVADDGSPKVDADATFAAVSGYPHRWSFLALDRIGWVAAVNRAVRETSGEVVLLVDDDVRVPRGLLGAIRSLEQALPGLGAVSWRSRGDRPGQSRDPRPGFLQPATEIAAYCMAFRRATFEEVGGLDERFKVYCSDSDLSVRMSFAGHPCYRAWWPLVPHDEHRCAVESPELDLGAVAEADRRRFVEKWGMEGPNLERAALAHLAGV